ncbi:MAG: hypothetical protein N3E46_12925 [Gemmataceae bacterium]|jgi:hypothetical protein|uniref:Cytochrome c-552/4 domain-containing protein n=1 Tax=Thermogemmata fonticola TaxID=2755323 RepID=A0A7V8VB12_9BACT|nr:multiheme c-type cytochrome [Thermogemmata fonticola]MBA2224728.1 hypothetical protein [Thermogemmata fonticola]MCX8140577.1 hypothetical protein [Gemmataceae bacterium]
MDTVHGHCDVSDGILRVGLSVGVAETPSRAGTVSTQVWRVAAAGVLLGLLVASGTSAPPAAEPPQEPRIGGLPLFADWPRDQRPAAVLVVSGQTYGFLQPCGCTRPQLGGLERRAQLVQSLKAKGWPVAGVDLGDIYPQQMYVRKQGLLRYETIMHALHAMGYLAVGVGKTDIEAELDKLLTAYALQHDRPPYVLAANLLGQVEGKAISRQERFQPAGLQRPLVERFEVAKVGEVSVGIVGLIGRTLAEEIESQKLDPSITFVKNGQGKIDNGAVLREVLPAVQQHPLRPQLLVLLYQGSAEEAGLLARDFPQFQVIVCRSEESEPPQFATRVNNGATLIVQVGHKGRYVGVVGAFPQRGGSWQLQYQLVPLTEYYITPGSEADALRNNPVLPLLQTYAERVRDRNLLEAVAKRPHPVQIQHPDLNLSYYGSHRCQYCHAADYRLWERSAHSHALDTLEQKARRPSLRQFDPECVICHSVGLEYQSGFVSATKTPALKHVGCESCHGPGSGHATNPQHAGLQLLMSPWKQEATDRLPSVDVMKKLAALSLVEQRQAEQALPPAQRRTVERVASMCMKCHDHDNDPYFNLYVYWPKIAHGMKP